MSELSRLNAAIRRTLKQFDTQFEAAEQEFVGACRLVRVGCRNEQDYALNDNHPHAGCGQRPTARTKEVRSSRLLSLPPDVRGPRTIFRRDQIDSELSQQFRPPWLEPG
jgi:hypothetical protein